MYCYYVTEENGQLKERILFMQSAAEQLEEVQNKIKTPVVTKFFNKCLVLNT